MRGSTPEIKQEVWLRGVCDLQMVGFQCVDGRCEVFPPAQPCRKRDGAAGEINSIRSAVSGGGGAARKDTRCEAQLGRDN